MSLEMQIVMADYPSVDGAKDALQIIKDKKLDHGAAAILSKEDNGKIHIKETDDWGGGKGAVAGAIAGAVLPVVGMIGGAIIGGLAAKLRDRGFPNEDLQQMAEQMEPGRSLLVVTIRSEDAYHIERVLQDTGGELISHRLDAELHDEIEGAVEDDEA